jgi:TPR repeat protein
MTLSRSLEREPSSEVSPPSIRARLGTHLTDGSGAVVHDYILDHLSTQASGLPEQTWNVLATGLATGPEDLRIVGLSAHLTHQDVPTAERLLTAAAERGLASAMFSLAILLLDARGRMEEVERWFRAAAAAGDAPAMNGLAILMERSGEDEEVERCAANLIEAVNQEPPPKPKV